MDEWLRITSSKNERIKKLSALRKPRERKKTGRFFIEGYRELLRATEGGFRIEELYICPSLFLRKENEISLIEKIAMQKAQIFHLPSSLFSKLSYRDRPDGLLGVGLQKKSSLTELTASSLPFFLVVESIEKPGNLGTILRSSDAAGVDAVIIADPCTDMYNPNVIRSSVGSLFTQLVIEEKKEKIFPFLQEKKIKKIAATPHATKLFTEVDFAQPIAIFLGSEQYGLTEECLQKADQTVRIPMYGKADSLNVAQATTLLLYEALRQRHSVS